MFTAFDHIIILVADLEKAAANFRALGFQVTHRDDQGVSETAHYLVSFADGSYLELFTFPDAAKPSAHRWWPLLANGDGFVDYSLTTTDLATDLARLDTADIPHGPLQQGGKVRIDGEPWTLRISTLGRPSGHPALPFLVEDVTPHNIRVPVHGGESKQPAAAINGVTIATTDAGKILPALTALFGNPESRAPRAGAQAAWLFRFGTRWVEVLAGRAAGDDALAQHLARHGDGVWEIALGEREPGAGKLLSLDLSHGARIVV